MKSVKIIYLILFIFLFFSACITKEKNEDITKIWLIGDSTMANYALEDDYMQNRYPVTGWGQVFQPFMAKDSLTMLNNLIKTDSVVVDDRAKGGRSTRTFFQEGRWRFVYENMKPGDLVLIQFGHNDGSKSKHERYVNIEGYKEFLRLFVVQARQKGGIPVLLTPVARNYPWRNGHLENVHKGYPDAMKAVAEELDVLLVDLNQRSMNHFSEMGRDYVSENYFMNLPAGMYEAYPDGQDDNTHFQPEGAKVVSQLVFDGLKEINNQIE
jgi:lysophospholipase L1-like esterase